MKGDEHDVAKTRAILDPAMDPNRLKEQIEALNAQLAEAEVNLKAKTRESTEHLEKIASIQSKVADLEKQLTKKDNEPAQSNKGSIVAKVGLLVEPPTSARPKMLPAAHGLDFLRVVRSSTLPASVLLVRERMVRRLNECGKRKLATMFEKTYTNTLETTVSYVNDGSVFVITGDIDHMWLRDSAAQVSHYLEGNLARQDVQVQLLIEGVIKRQMHFISKDPYANSYKVNWNANPSSGDKRLGRGGHVATRNYELDSLCYFLRLSYLYWNQTRDMQTDVFDQEWVGAVKTIVDLLIVEQEHEAKSPYRYVELSRNGLGSPTKRTGMTWTAFRPSDDPCTHHYLIPSNAFAVTTLEYASEMLEKIPSAQNPELAKQCASLAEEIDKGIHEFGIKEESGFGKVYAFEVDGLGGQHMMDDANVPSLLSLNYLGYKSKRDPNGEIAANTRKWVLSPKNPYMVNGKWSGIGSPHTPRGSIWPMSLIMEVFTSNDHARILELFQILQDTDAGTNFMHESFMANNPGSFTRKWFAWVNSLLSEAIMRKIDHLCPKK